MNDTNSNLSMRNTMPSPTTPATDSIELVFRRSDGSSRVHSLEDGGYVLVGASEVCGITLKDAALAPIHCALRREGSQLWIEDWDSDGGVSVDGERIDSQTPVTAASDVRIGDYRLTITSDGSEPRQLSAAAEMEADRTVSSADVEPYPSAETGPVGDEPDLIAAQRPAEEPPSATFSGRGSATSTSADECSDTESIEVLRAEVEQLQYELADRDAQLAELTDLSCERPMDEDDEEDEALLARLEDLLSELEHSDEQSAMLERLLETSEEKSRAEQEERRQLTAWVDDIEERLSEREAEWRSEQEALQFRVRAALEERDELMQQLSGESASSEQAPASSDEAEELRAKSLQIRQMLHEAEDRQAHLEQQLRERDKQLATRSEAETALREEHLKLAQERATLARQQSEMATAQSVTANAPNRPETEIDCRLREFRQHLREIHQEEQRSRTTMAERISRLWARIEGAEGR